MNYVKIIVKSNYVDLRLFIKENETFKVLELIRSIHGHTKAGAHDYSPYRGHYQRPPNNLHVSLRKVRIDNKRARATGANKILNDICARSIDSLQTKFTQYSNAA